MRTLRLFVLMLLCLAVPVLGLAGLHASTIASEAQPDVLAHMSSMEMADMGMQATDHDCCDEAEQAAPNGKTMCKTCPDCRVSAQYPVSLLPAFHLPTERAPHFPPLVLTVRSFDASSVWRPPTRA